MTISDSVSKLVSPVPVVDTRTTSYLVPESKSPTKIVFSVERAVLNHGGLTSSEMNLNEILVSVGCLEYVLWYLPAFLYLT